ncbi:hypothetical protein [Hahella sp. HN01]|uniref:hypothetical protein n=1 Tax=Hahella sp. HN01 TaxID=2847262 RepID=UPI001C1EB5A3|nr:hypothetical protein [Hahella sp. HN01]MBU6952151.1 hypothetical protein [Hahella sp. HN01]
MDNELIDMFDEMGRFTSQASAIAVALSADCEEGEILGPGIKANLLWLLTDRLEDISSLSERLIRFYKEKT